MDFKRIWWWWWWYTLSNCIQSIESWFLLNNLQLNPTKTVLILLGTPYQLKLLSNISSVNINNISVPFHLTSTLFHSFIHQPLNSAHWLPIQFTFLYNSKLQQLLLNCFYHQRLLISIVSSSLNQLLAILDHHLLFFSINNLHPTTYQKEPSAIHQQLFGTPSHQISEILHLHYSNQN